MRNQFYKSLIKTVSLIGLFCIPFLFLCSSALAQNNTVSGTVTDAQTGDPLVGVNILVVGTSIGTATDAEGHFSLNVSSLQDSLRFSYIGYQTATVGINGRTTINIELKSTVVSGEQLVVVGYGMEKEKNVTGSIATVKSSDLTKVPLGSTTNSLAGQIPGLITKQTSGLPGGDAASLSIRNFGDPLIVVDGNVVNTLNNVDQNSIESISVLKDASAAIYGARAGNGVILVTTKQGQKGKPKITFNSTLTFQNPTNRLKLPSSGQEAEMELEEHLNQGKPIDTAPFTPKEVQLYYAGNDPDYPSTNWYDVAARPWAPQTKQDLTVSGGTGRINYFTLLGYLNQKSLWKNNGGGYKRYNLRTNMNIKIQNNLIFKINLSGILEKRRYPSRANEGSFSIWNDLWYSEPFYPAHLPDPTKISAAASNGIGSVLITSSRNYGYRNQDSEKLNSTLSLEYDFAKVDGLSAKIKGNYSQIGFDNKHLSYLVKSYKYNYSSDEYTLVNGGSPASLSRSDGKSTILRGRLSVSYKHNFNDLHQFSGKILFEVRDSHENSFSAARSHYLTKKIDYLFAGNPGYQTNYGSASVMGRRSLVGIVNYSYKDKYLLKVTLRIDESAKFDKQHRRGYFPGISLGWRISDEKFIRNNISFISNLKLRLSYGKMGNDKVGNFKYLSAYKLSSGYILGSSLKKGITQTGLPNPNLTWEEITIYNAGLDFGFIEERIYGSIDGFYRLRDGIPGQPINSLPSSFGATLPTKNLNAINTRGFELSLGYKGREQFLDWSISGNLSWSRSKWDYYDEPAEFKNEATKRLNKLTGKWTDVTFGYKSKGLFTSQEEIDNLGYVYESLSGGNASLKPGDIYYADVNNDGVLNYKDKVNIGKGSEPNWTAGINLGLNFWNFDISVLFQAAFGFYNNVTLDQSPRMYPRIVYEERWTPENNNENAIYPRLGGSPSNSWFSDYGFIDASYIRLKTLNVGYNLPKHLFSSVGINKLRIYFAGTNLLTLSKMNKFGIDPEAPSGNSAYYYPQMLTITGGLNISF